MKAQIESSGSNVYIGAIHSGRVHKAKHSSGKVSKKLEVKMDQGVIMKEEDNAAEILAYLTKLQEIVPVMPKNKRLSKVEVIDHVIDYIRELSETLGMPASPEPCNNNKENFSCC